jgi:hypothetical protein
MSIWNKILIGCICVASLVFFVMVARTVRTHQHWRQLADKFQKRIAEVREESRKLKQGDGDWMGMAQAHLESSKLASDLGRVWYHCTPKPWNAQTGQGSVAIEMPKREAEPGKPETPLPHGIADKTILHVFEKEDLQKGGHYLGEFKVVGVTDRDVALQPTHKLSDAQLQRLGQSKGPWILFAKLPLDSHEAFAGLKESQLKELLPEATVAEYIRDGQASQPGDPDRRKSNGKFVRGLRDYSPILEAFSTRRTVLVDSIEAGRRDQQAAEDALADAKAQQEFLQKQKASFVEEVAKFVRQRDAVVVHLKQIQQAFTSLQKQIVDQLALNQGMAAEITKFQFRARRIDQQTRSMAQAATGSVN